MCDIRSCVMFNLSTCDLKNQIRRAVPNCRILDCCSSYKEEEGEDTGMREASYAAWVWNSRGGIVIHTKRDRYWMSFGVFTRVAKSMPPCSLQLWSLVSRTWQRCASQPTFSGMQVSHNSCDHIDTSFHSHLNIVLPPSRPSFLLHRSLPFPSRRSLPCRSISRHVLNLGRFQLL